MGIKRPTLKRVGFGVRSKPGRACSGLLCVTNIYQALVLGAGTQRSPVMVPSLVELSVKLERQTSKDL